MFFRCKMCNADLEVQEGMNIAKCSYCGTEQTLPKFYGEESETMILYDRADHYRKSYDYDQAMDLYQKILDKNPQDAEAYWSMVLCRYGIEYVEDFKTKKRIPTINRMQYTSILVDEDYKAALQYADDAQRVLYERDVEEISKIQKNILMIVEKEEPFDIFICYKESDNNGRRSRDSVIANELYYELKEAGYRVFFSRITLEDKLGVDYEPYIFAALNTAKIMIVVGTNPEFFQAVWVKNEWSRFLNLIKNGEKKQLIPVYRDMDPYDLPKEFAHLQIMDMNDLGFMQELTRGIGKLITPKEKENSRSETVYINHYQGKYEVDQNLEIRAWQQLELGNWENADIFIEDMLNQNAHDSKAYFMKSLCIEKVKKKEDLVERLKPEMKRIIDRGFVNGALNEEHADSMAKRYKVPRSLLYSQIYNMYSGGGYNTTTEDMLELPLFNDPKALKSYERAKKYATGDFKQELEELQNDYVAALSEGKDMLAGRVRLNEDEIQERIAKIDIQVKQLYEAAYQKEHKWIAEQIKAFRGRFDHFAVDHFESHDDEYKIIKKYRGIFLEYQIYPETKQLIEYCDRLIALGDENEAEFQKRNRESHSSDTLMLRKRMSPTEYDPLMCIADDYMIVENDLFE